MTFKQVDYLHVEAWGRRVGVVVPDRLAYAFEYEPAWRRTGIDLAPQLMPVQARPRVWSFPTLPTQTFQGLPPMLADSAPDRFGNGLINAVLAREGVRAQDITALDRLAYVGSRAMGALTFVPEFERRSLPTVVEMTHLVEAARAALAGDLSDDRVATQAMKELVSVGTSAGGARAKAVLAWNPETGEMRAGGIPAPEGFEQWLLKFDGLGEDQQLGATGDWGRTEYAYSLMAHAAEVQMSECRLLEEGGRAHFMTRRFDRPGADGARLHMQSLCGLTAMDFNEVGVHDYASLFLTATELGIEEPEQLFRRLVFNVLASNNDDHTKNHAFLMDEQGRWSLAPAYDVTFAYNPASKWTAQHLMGVDGEFRHITRRHLERVVDQFHVPGYRHVIAEVADTVSRWPEFAAEAGLSPDRTREVQVRLDEVRLD